MFASLVEEIRLEASQPKSQRVSRKKANRYAAQFRMHSDPVLQKVSRKDAKEMARKAKDRGNKLAPQFVHGMRRDAGAKAQSPERQSKYRARTKYDWQTEAASKEQRLAGLAAAGGNMKKWQAKLKAKDMKKWSSDERARQKQVWRSNVQGLDHDRLKTKQDIATGKLHKDDPRFARSAMRHFIKAGAGKRAK